VRAGNSLRPLVDGEPAFRRICETVEAARKSVWVTIAFLGADFTMPDGRGSLFDLLDRAQARGVDVRVLFWRNNDGSGFPDHQMFSGSAEHRAMLDQRGSRFLARWDRATERYCQHQKSWLIDAGHANQIAFVGGINLNRSSLVSPGHSGAGAQTHDVYLEIEGPAVTDVHHNFVQRWNEASERSFEHGVWPDHSSQNDLLFPSSVALPAGDAVVQIQRTIRQGHYTMGAATPSGEPFPIHEGEFSIFEQYLAAIDAARRTIYIEDQAIGSPEVIARLEAALARGVDVVFLVPGNPHPDMKAARARAETSSFSTNSRPWDGTKAFFSPGSRPHNRMGVRARYMCTPRSRSSMIVGQRLAHAT